MDVRFFKNTAELRKWFRTNRDRQVEVYIGFYRKGCEKKAITYAEALDEALCWGWIDGIRKRVDDESYTNRFTPRKEKSIWSLVNIEHVARLTAEGRMQPSGLAAFEKRKSERTGVYSFEQDSVVFEPEMLSEFQSHKVAWEYWMNQPPGYRKVATHWVTSAKRVETRERRLRTLIEDCAQGLRLAESTGRKRGESR